MHMTRVGSCDTNRPPVLRGRARAAVRSDTNISRQSGSPCRGLAMAPRFKLTRRIWALRRLVCNTLVHWPLCSFSWRWRGESRSDTSDKELQQNGQGLSSVSRLALHSAHTIPASTEGGGAETASKSSFCMESASHASQLRSTTDCGRVENIAVGLIQYNSLAVGFILIELFV